MSLSDVPGAAGARLSTQRESAMSVYSKNHTAPMTAPGGVHGASRGEVAVGAPKLLPVRDSSQIDAPSKIQTVSRLLTSPSQPGE